MEDLPRKMQEDEIKTRREAYLKDLPEYYHPAVLKSYRSRASAIKAKCRDCMGHENTTNRIRACEIVECALWPHRPKQRSRDVPPEADTRA